MNTRYTFWQNLLLELERQLDTTDEEGKKYKIEDLKNLIEKYDSIS